MTRPEFTPEVEAWLLTPFSDSTWTMFEVFQVGRALLNHVNATMALGHASPGSTLDYGKPWYDDLPTDLVADVLAWTSSHDGTRPPGAEDRVRQEIVESGWQRHAMNQLGEHLGLGGAA